MFKKVIFAVAVLMGFTGISDAGSIYVKYNEEKIALFEAVGVSYYDLHRLVSRFTNSNEFIEASPPGKIHIKIHDVSWSDLMDYLHNSEIFNISKSSNGGLIVTRKKSVDKE